MLKRANVSLATAAVIGLLAYTNSLETLAPAFTISFFVLVGFSAVSFLLCLFEDESVPALPPVEPSVVLSWQTPDLVRVAP